MERVTLKSDLPGSLGKGSLEIIVHAFQFDLGDCGGLGSCLEWVTLKSDLPGTLGKENLEIIVHAFQFDFD